MFALPTWEFESDWAFGYEMGKLGRSLANGDGFIMNEGESPTAAFPPIFPLVIAAFFSLFGDYSQGSVIGVLLFQSICAAFTAVLLVVVGRRFGHSRIGLIAGFVWAFYPTSVFYSVIHVWHCELALALLFLAAVIAVTAQPPATIARSILFGAISGLTILTDPTLAVYLALLLFWMLLMQGTPILRLVVLLLAGGITVGAVVSPWAIHNWIYVGSPRIVKSNFGEALFLGNHSLVVGENTKEERFLAYTTVDQDELKYYENQPELIQDRYFMNKAVDWIQNNPLRFAQLTAYRTWFFWVRNPALGTKGWLRFAYLGPLLVLALYGLWIGIRRRWSLAPLWLFMLVQPLPYYLTHVAAGRYSYPVEPFVVLLAAIPLAIWSEHYLRVSFLVSRPLSH